jgi:hypothetical protein
MSKYKVAYIDESDIDIRRFQRFARNYLEVIPFKPNRDMEITVAEVLESKVDAIIADFDLSEQDETIHYNGDELMNSILDERELFPVFILTSYEDDAVSQGEDVNIVYEKSEMANGEKFLKRVITQIEKYYKRLDEAEKRLLELIDKGQQTQLDAKEEKELSDLDSFIEKSLNKKIVVPDKIKKDEEED